MHLFSQRKYTCTTWVPPPLLHDSTAPRWDTDPDVHTCIPTHIYTVQLHASMVWQYNNDDYRQRGNSRRRCFFFSFSVSFVCLLVIVALSHWFTCTHSINTHAQQKCHPVNSTASRWARIHMCMSVFPSASIQYECMCLRYNNTMMITTLDEATCKDSIFFSLFCLLTTTTSPYTCTHNTTAFNAGMHFLFLVSFVDYYYRVASPTPAYVAIMAIWYIYSLASCQCIAWCTLYIYYVFVVWVHFE